MKENAITSRRISLFEKFRNHWFCCTYYHETIRYDNFGDSGRTTFSPNRYVPKPSLEPDPLAKLRTNDSSSHAAIRLAKLAESVHRTRTSEN
nr:MAG: Px protein [Sobemovirus sp.]